MFTRFEDFGIEWQQNQIKSLYIRHQIIRYMHDAVEKNIYKKKVECLVIN